MARLLSLHVRWEGGQRQCKLGILWLDRRCGRTLAGGLAVAGRCIALEHAPRIRRGDATSGRREQQADSGDLARVAEKALGKWCQPRRQAGHLGTAELSVEEQVLTMRPAPIGGAAAIAMRQ